MTTFNWQGCFAPLLDDLDSRGLERWRKQLQQQLPLHLVLGMVT